MTVSKSQEFGALTVCLMDDDFPDDSWYLLNSASRIMYGSHEIAYLGVKETTVRHPPAEASHQLHQNWDVPGLSRMEAGGSGRVPGLIRRPLRLDKSERPPVGFPKYSVRAGGAAE